MKISEMSTKQAAACMCRIAEPLSRIAQDNTLNGFLKNLSADRKVSAGKTVLQVAAGAMSTLIPVLLEHHFEDAVAVLSELTGKDKAQIEAQSILVTMQDARSIIDKDLIDFFTASAPTDGEK